MKDENSLNQDLQDYRMIRMKGKLHQSQVLYTSPNLSTEAGQLQTSSARPIPLLFFLCEDALFLLCLVQP